MTVKKRHAQVENVSSGLEDHSLIKKQDATNLTQILAQGSLLLSKSTNALNALPLAALQSVELQFNVFLMKLLQHSASLTLNNLSRISDQ